MSQRSVFSCILDGQPDHLTPPQVSSYWSEDMAGRPLFLNPDCQLRSSGELPNGVSLDKPLIETFAPMEDMAWVHNSGIGAWQPFWLGRGIKAALADLQDGTPVTSLPHHCQRSLAMAGVLIDRQNTSHRDNLAASLSRSADHFQRNGYAPVRGLIHPFHISAMRRYYRNLVRTGNLPLGDGQSSRRYHAHNEGVARFFHLQLTGAMSKIAGQTVKPSYVYFVSYQGGALLEKHTDRCQCEFSITLCLDYSPEPQVATPWPLKLHTPKGTTTVYQSIGDGLAYRGCEVPHSRGVLPRGHTSTSIFFHYVREDFSGPLD
jgi:hypothetical protein